VPFRLLLLKPMGLIVVIGLLEPQDAIKTMLVIAARAMSRRPAHFVEARGFIKTLLSSLLKMR
jgi:hypothetical protein